MRKRVVLLNGSMERSLINFRAPLLREIRGRGYDVHASAPTVSDGTREALRSLGIRSHDLPLQRTGTGIAADYAYFRALRKLMQDCQPELVLGYTVKPNIWGSLAARSLGIPSASMVTGLGYAFTETGGLGRKVLGGVARVLYRAATAANRKVIFQNPDDVRDFIAAGCLTDRSKAAIVNGSGVDTRGFALQPLPEKPSFLMVSRLLGNKGVREYGEAATILRQRGYDWPFVLVGPNDPQADSIAPAELEKWVESGAIDYGGRATDVRPALGEASVYVLPSYREGTPRSVLEAMAVGRPVVTTDAPGCRETVQDGVNGLLVPVKDASALADAMETMGNNAQLRTRMGQQSRRIAEEKYDDRRVAASVCDILEL